MISVIIPLFNEYDNLKLLYEKLTYELPLLGQDFEVIFVNDGSKDGSEVLLAEMANKEPHFKVVNLRRNYGQTAAMMAGIDFATGEIIVPMDGDLQNDPADIHHLINKINEGYDVVSGWRKHRKDTALKRNFPSRIANLLISWISGVHLHDYGCSLKAYRRNIIKDVKLYGEMHRFIPIYASWLGARVTELPVSHYPRIHGASKYGLERVIKVVLDLLLVKFLSKYDTKPIYIFGGFGLITIVISIFAALWAVYLKFFEHTTFIQTPLPLVSIMTFITGVMSILMGVLAELIIRTYYESQDKSVYLIKNTFNIKDQ